MEETAKYFKKAVLFTDLRFAIALPKFCATHRNLKFCQNHWSLLKSIATETHGFYLYFLAFKKFEPVKYTI
jgi:hypothetical protein